MRWIQRICPGRHLAEGSYWAIASSMIALFDISKPLDSDGNEIDVPLEFTRGFVRYVFFFLPSQNFGDVFFFLFILTRHPKPFKCSIKPRSPDLPDLISQARAELDVE